MLGLNDSLVNGLVEDLTAIIDDLPPRNMRGCETGGRVQKKKKKRVREEVEVECGRRKGKWLKEEETILKNNAREYLELNNLSLPQLFALPKKERKQFFVHCTNDINRPYTNVWKKCVRMFDYKNNLGTYTESECKQLVKLSDKYVDGEMKWKIIGEKIGRSASSVRDRVTKVGKTVQTKKRQKWSTVEKERFQTACSRHTSDWNKISEYVGTRTARQCLKHSSDLKIHGSGSKITLEEQVTMVELLSRQAINYLDDIDWHKLVESWPGGATKDTINSTNLRSRFKQLVNYRVPLQQQLTFNDIIDILMENFVQPYKEGRKVWGLKERLKEPKSDNSENEENTNAENEDNDSNSLSFVKKETVELDMEITIRSQTSEWARECPFPPSEDEDL